MRAFEDGLTWSKALSESIKHDILVSSVKACRVGVYGSLLKQLPAHHLPWLAAPEIVNMDWTSTWTGEGSSFNQAKPSIISP